MDKFGFIDEKLANLRQKQLFRNLNPVKYTSNGLVRFDQAETDKVLFCSNDYLNIANDERIKQAVCRAVNKYGFGSGSSRLICGTHKLHKTVEEAFAPLLGYDSALLFNSGWTANEAVLKTLPQKDDIVLIDRNDHASIIDAVKSSPAKFRTFLRNDLSRLERYLADNSYKRKYIVTESVFSMDGDCADLETLIKLKNTYGAILIVDEAHSIGCFGKNGSGLMDELGFHGQADIVIAPLGKTFAASGAIVASQKKVIDYLINKARPFIYTTAPPPVNCAAIMTALQIIETEPQRRNRLAQNAAYLRDELSRAGFDTGSSSTQIIPIIIGDPDTTLKVSSDLYDRGFYACAIRPPTVAKNSSRLRISLQSGHTLQQIDNFITALKMSTGK